MRAYVAYVRLFHIDTYKIHQSFISISNSNSHCLATTSDSPIYHHHVDLLNFGGLLTLYIGFCLLLVLAIWERNCPALVEINRLSRATVRSAFPPPLLTREARSLLFLAALFIKRRPDTQEGGGVQTHTQTKSISLNHSMFASDHQLCLRFSVEISLIKWWLARFLTLSLSLSLTHTEREHSSLMMIGGQPYCNNCY